jgi:hypothetical protein
MAQRKKLFTNLKHVREESKKGFKTTLTPPTTAGKPRLPLEDTNIINLTISKRTCGDKRWEQAAASSGSTGCQVLLVLLLAAPSQQVP